MEKLSFVQEFDELTKAGLIKSLSAAGEIKPFTELKIAAAVSGGADSIALLTSLSHLVKNSSFLEVITVNHNIREEAETSGDASFVEEYAGKLGLSCTRVEIERGKIESLAVERKTGVEEAARFVRYEAFDTFCRQKNIDYICLAHNQNDQSETVLMRFLQGSSAGSLAGIPLSRQKFLRPLLGVDRNLIEKYLCEQNILWRTDSTNLETEMLRNKMRNTIIPVIEKEVPGWKTAVLSLSQKMREDEEYFSEQTELALKRINFTVSETDICFETIAFAKEAKSIQRRITARAVEKCCASERVPYSFTENIIGSANDFLLAKNNTSCNQKIFFSKDLEARIDSTKITVSKKLKDATESGFFVIIKENGSVQAGPWNIEISSLGNGTSIELSAKNEEFNAEGTVVLKDVKFPFAIRSRQPGDSIEAADKSNRFVQKIFENWHVNSNAVTGEYFDRDIIPVIQELTTPSQKLICVWGSLCGYMNWIVK